MKDWEGVLIDPGTSLRDALQAIDGASSQMALVVDEKRRLLGTLSDGDVRRALLRGLVLTDAVALAMYREPTVAQANEGRYAILSRMRQLGLNQMPVVDEANVVVGLELISDFLNTPVRENWVVVMAGGLGSRLHELTSDTPKPMLKIGSRPLLETIVRNYAEQGFRRFYFAVNYRAEQIEAHFGDGESLGVEVRYLRERHRLGTAGALSLLGNLPNIPLLVTNGDLLVHADFGEMLDQHERMGVYATMAVREYQYQIPYGVIRLDGSLIECVEEKPVYRSLVSAGMYVLSPEAVRLVPENTFYDMPTLFSDLMAAGKNAATYQVTGYWVDIGRISDYERANRDYADGSFGAGEQTGR